MIIIGSDNDDGVDGDFANLPEEDSLILILL